MRAERPLRLPLQIGTSALYSLLRGAALGVPAFALAAIGGEILDAYGNRIPGADYAGAIVAIAGVVGIMVAYKHLRRAYRERPSDLLITDRGFAIFGGLHHGKHVAWSSVSGVTVDKPVITVDNVGDEDLRILSISTDDGTDTLAAADTFAEQQSLDELAITLRAMSPLGEPAGASPDVVLAAPVSLLRCAECNGELAPIDAAETRCPYCEHVSPVPAEIRRQVADAAALQARPDAAIAKLLQQPSARAVGVLYVLGAAVSLVAWPLSLGVMALAYHAHTLTPERVVFLLGFVGAALLGCYALIRSRLVDRGALRLVALEYGAIEPQAVGEPVRCQRCMAPLPDAGPDRVVVRCVACSADNVLGLHIARRATVAREEASSLADALDRRTRERRGWFVMLITAAVLLVVAGILLRHGLGH